MKVLVVYESSYGNTAAIGEAIAAALRAEGLEVESGSVEKVRAIDIGAADLLVAGGPTHMHGMSRPSTRKAGAKDEKNTFDEPTVTTGLREWLTDVPSGANRPAAAYDTRFDKSTIVTGSAAKGIAKRLEQQAFRLLVGPESFFVTNQNRLVDGELEHAAAWARTLAQHATAGVAG
jgi:Flavodoxin domain